MLDAHVSVRWDEITEEEWTALETLRVERNKLQDEKADPDKTVHKLKALKRTS